MAEGKTTFTGASVEKLIVSSIADARRTYG
jgi:hypothetical protein